MAAVTVVALIGACGSEETPTESTDPVTEVDPIAASSGVPITLPESFDSGIVDGFGDVSGFYGTTFSHGTFDTRQLQGKPIVVNFWFPSCPPCRAELEHFEEVYQEFGTPSGSDVEFVGIQQLGLDSIEDGAALFDEIGVTFAGLPDNKSSIQIKYNIFSYPTTVFLDRDHNEFRVWQGAIDKENLASIVQELAETTASINDSEPEIDRVEVTSDIVTGEIEHAAPERQFARSETVDGLGDAPGFRGETLHHGMFDLRSHLGKPVVINFWFPSCPPCRAEMPNFEYSYQLLGEYGKDKLVFVGIQAVGLDTPADGDSFMESIGATYPSIVDVGGAIHIAYEISSAPTTYFLDHNHDIVNIHRGYLSITDLQGAIDELLEGFEA